VKWFVVLLGALSIPAHAADAFTVSQLAPGIYLHEGTQVALDAAGHDDIANIGFIVGERCVAVIDSGGSMNTGRKLRAAIKQTTRKPICYVINTHVHVDHVLGNAAFRADRPKFVGHAALAEAMRNSQAFFVKQYAADLDMPASVEQIIGPEILVSPQHDQTLDLGHRILHLRAWPKAHTDCDLSIVDERTATLWAGDLLFRERIPALDGSVRGWIAAIDQLAAMKVSWVIPGHGPPSRDLSQALIPERRYLQALVDGVSAALSQGKSVQEAIGQVALEEQPHWLLWDTAHAHNVIRVYEELQWE
jgi:quinoprotein relay system zinc metallohydrolase 2